MLKAICQKTDGNKLPPFTKDFLLNRCFKERVSGRFCRNSFGFDTSLLPSRNLSPFIRNGLEKRTENGTYMYKTKQVQPLFSTFSLLPSRNLSPFIRNGLEKRIESWTYMYKTKQVQPLSSTFRDTVIPQTFIDQKQCEKCHTPSVEDGENH